MDAGGRLATARDILQFFMECQFFPNNLRCLSKIRTSWFPESSLLKRLLTRGQQKGILKVGVVEGLVSHRLVSYTYQKRAEDVITNGPASTYGCLELNSGSLEEHLVLLTTEPSSQC